MISVISIKIHCILCSRLLSWSTWRTSGNLLSLMNQGTHAWLLSPVPQKGPQRLQKERLLVLICFWISFGRFVLGICRFATKNTSLIQSFATPLLCQTSNSFSYCAIGWAHKNRKHTTRCWGKPTNPLNARTLRSTASPSVVTKPVCPQGPWRPDFLVSGVSQLSITLLFRDGEQWLQKQKMRVFPFLTGTTSSPLPSLVPHEKRLPSVKPPSAMRLVPLPLEWDLPRSMSWATPDLRPWREKAVRDWFISGSSLLLYAQKTSKNKSL